jgi:16S rRNA (adenine1518-N6/adenine1519-N6)-dimethyltransferase
MRPKKSLGQNFLKSKEALRLIIEAGDLKPTDTVLEIGPGRGVLTSELLMKAGMMVAVEKDDDLIDFLKEKFAAEIASGMLVLIHGDILEMDLETLDLAMKQGGHQPADKQPTGKFKYKLIANIPYYITGALLKKFLQGSATNFNPGSATTPNAGPIGQPERMVLLVQKEVAERIVARDGKESILSISVKAYGQPRYVKTVKAKYFSPEPKVDSAIIAIENISKDFFRSDTRAFANGTNKAGHGQDIDENKFFHLVKAGFAHKRKMLRGNLNGSHGSDKGGEIEKIFKSIGLPPTIRAEEVHLETWKKIFILERAKGQ